MRFFLWFSNTVINVRNAGLHCSSSCIRNNLFRSFFYLACLLDFLGVFFPSSMKCLKRGVTLFVFAKWTTLHDERGAQDNEQGLKGTPIHFRENKKYCRWRFLLILNIPFNFQLKLSTFKSMYNSSRDLFVWLFYWNEKQQSMTSAFSLSDL